MTDPTGRAVVIGSACRCTIFHAPSSGAMIIVTRRLEGVMASCPPNLAWDRSTLTRYASSGVTWLVTVSASTISPSRTCDAAWSITAAACSHPRTKGPKGLPRVTSCRWENHFFTRSGFPSEVHPPLDRIARSIPQRRLAQSSRPTSPFESSVLAANSMVNSLPATKLLMRG